MRRILPLILLSLFISNISSAQYFRWAKGMGGSTTGINIKDVATDASGNVISTGQFIGTVDFDPNPGVSTMTSQNHSQPDAYVQKLDANGNFIWAKSLGDQEWDRGDAIKTDAAGNIYIAGRFQGTVDFDPGPGTFSLTTKTFQATEIFIVKLDASGNFLWAVQRQSTGMEDIYAGNVDLTIDNSGNLYSVRSFKSFSSDYRYMIVEKMDNSGNKVWDYKVAEMPMSYSNIVDQSIALDAGGNVIVAGSYSGSLAFDGTNGISSFGGANMFVLKLGNSGSFSWVRTFIYGTSNAYDVVTDAMGDIYIGGEFSDIVDFDPGLTTQLDTASTYQSMYLVKLTAAGDYSWVKTFPATGSSIIYALATDAAGNVYATGTFASQSTFRSSSPAIIKNTANNNADAFLMQFTPSGNVQWVKQMGGPDTDIPYAVALSTTGDAYVVGTYFLTANFDWDGAGAYMTTIGYEDVFISKFAQCPIINTSVTQVNNILTATTTAVSSYQWIDCASQKPIPGATAQTYAATANGSYAVILSQNGCTDTSSCFTVSGVGFKEISSGNTMNLFPNPNNGEFVIKGIGADNSAAVNITNIYGQNISSLQRNIGDDVSIKLNAPAGVYFVTVVTISGIQTERILVR